MKLFIHTLLVTSPNAFLLAEGRTMDPGDEPRFKLGCEDDGFSELALCFTCA